MTTPFWKIEMMMTETQDHFLATQARLVTIVMVSTMVSWLGAPWLGGLLGWNAQFVFLFDMLAIAAFVWALSITLRLWHRRNVDHRSN